MEKTKKGLFTTEDGTNHVFIFFLVALLFTLWAVGNSLIDTMDKHFQDYYHLTKADSANVQFSHYLGYFFMALPAGWFISKLGYKWGIVLGLSLAALGCLWFYPATKIDGFWAVLLGVCLVAMGFSFLETVANPYTTVLGHPKYAASRINLAQSFNAIGWPIAPYIGGLYFYHTDTSLNSQQNAVIAHQTMWIPYVGLALIILVLIVAFIKSKMPDVVEHDHSKSDSEENTVKVDVFGQQGRLSTILLYVCAIMLSFALGMIVRFFVQLFYMDRETLGNPEAMVALNHLLKWVFNITTALIGIGSIVFITVKRTKLIHKNSLWSAPHFTGATISQFLYVAAQAGIFSFFINYMVEEVPAIGESMKSSWFIGGENGSILRNGAYFLTERGATSLMSYMAFPLFLIGRFTGSFILRVTKAHNMLGLYSLINVLLMFVIVAKLGWLSVAAVFLSFFFMSIMFPTIFSLGIWGLGEKSKLASSFIVMAIMGGAVLPKVMGAIADVDGMSAGYVVPAVCFGVIALYGFFWTKLSGSQGLNGVKIGTGH
ncbi:MAG TPA: MFS transporter [Prolixibacteraceae bacterium]|jgi:FHS family L-fucose permease-like MFS transporter